MGGFNLASLGGFGGMPPRQITPGGQSPWQSWGGGPPQSVNSGFNSSPAPFQPVGTPAPYQPVQSPSQPWAGSPPQNLGPQPQPLQPTGGPPQNVGAGFNNSPIDPRFAGANPPMRSFFGGGGMMPLRSLM